MNEKTLSWDLTKLYDSFQSDEFKKDLASLGPLIKEFKDFIDNVSFGQSPINTIKKYIKFSTDFDSLFIKLMSYAQLRIAVNTNDKEAIKYLSVIENIRSEKVMPVVKFQRYLLNLNNMDEVLKNSEINNFAFHIKELRQKAKYMLGDEEEALYAALKQTGSGAFASLQDKVTSNLMIDIEIDGKRKSLPLSAIRNLAYDKSKTVRKKAYEAELDSYKKIESVSAAALNSIKGEVITISKKRGYDSVLDMSLKDARADKETLDAMLTAMKESLPDFIRYFKKKAEYLGDKNGLKFYNLFAPVGESDLKFTYSQAKEFILKHFYGFSEKLGDYAKKAFENNWIDPFPKSGKLGGAFCANIHPIKESRILTNFDGSFNAVDTLAHELGHGYHGEILTNVELLNSEYPMPLAETASIFCETLIFNAALKEADDKNKTAILETSVMSSAQVIVDIYSRFLFESEFIAKREEGFVDVEEIKEIMIKAQKEAYKNGLDENYLHPYMWACKPHYYDADYNFYNYPYAFGLLFARGLYAVYQKTGSEFVEIYDELLKRTGSDDIYNVVKFIGIDLHDVDFWRDSLKTVISEIDELMELMDKGK